MSAPLLLPNVIISTSRAAYNQAPTAKLTNLGGCHIEAVHGVDYATLPAAALDSKFKLKVPRGTDLVEGDKFTAITQISDGTSWLPTNPMEILTVAYIEDSSPGILPCRIAYINRGVVGGPSK